MSSSSFTKSQKGKYNVLYHTRNMNQTKLQARLGGHRVQRVENVECEKWRVRWKKKQKKKLIKSFYVCKCSYNRMLYSVKADLTQLVISYCSLKQYLSASNHPKMFFCETNYPYHFFYSCKSFWHSIFLLEKGFLRQKCIQRGYLHAHVTTKKF